MKKSDSLKNNAFALASVMQGKWILSSDCFAFLENKREAMKAFAFYLDNRDILNHTALALGNGVAYAKLNPDCWHRLLNDIKSEVLSDDIRDNFNQELLEDAKKPSENKVIKTPRIGFVYLMRNIRNGFTKIGFSSSVSKRERTLQSEEPEVQIIYKGEYPLTTSNAPKI